MNLTEKDTETLNDFENFFQFQKTWPVEMFLNAPEKFIGLFTGNQAMKTGSVSYQYVLRILGLHPVTKKNVVYFECKNGHAFTFWEKPEPKDPEKPLELECTECGMAVTEHPRKTRKFRFGSETLPGDSGDDQVAGESTEVKNTQYP